MGFCSISRCGNSSKTCNFTNKGITFHRRNVSPSDDGDYMIKAKEQHLLMMFAALAGLKRTGETCDVFLQVEPKSSTMEAVREAAETGVWAHRAVLGAASPYFHDVFQNSDQQRKRIIITVPRVTSETLRLLVDNMYTPTSLSVTVEEGKSLLAAATHLSVADVRDEASAYLARSLAVDNVLGIYVTAESNGCPALTALAENFIQKDGERVLQVDEFLSMQPSILGNLLARGKLAAPAECTLKAVLRWTMHRPQERREHLSSLLHVVQLPQVPRELLYKVSREEPIINNAPAVHSIALVFANHHPQGSKKNTQKSGRSIDSKLASSHSSGPRAAVSTSLRSLAVGDCNKNAEVIPDVSSYERSSGSSQAAAVTVLDDRSFKGTGSQPAPSGSKLPEVESQNHDTPLQEEQMLIRKKTFTKWINSFLERDRMDVNDLFVDLADGRQLHKLLEIISGERLPRLNSGQMKIHKIENVKRCIKFLSSKVRLESIDAEGIVNGNPVQILNLIWTIIQRFQIQEIEVNVDKHKKRSEKKCSREALLLWCQQNTSGYQGVDIKNFTDSWRSGLGFNALIHTHRPDLFNWMEVPTIDYEDMLNHAFDVAHKSLAVPRLLDAEDVDISVPDEESIMTYLACYYHTFTSTNNEQTSGRSVDSERQQHLFKPLLPPGKLTQRVRAEPLVSAEHRVQRQLVEAMPSHLTVSDGRELTLGRERWTQQPLATDSGPHALLVVGGDTSDVLSFELSSGRWQSAAALPAARMGAGVAVLDGRVYVVGGWDGRSIVNTVFMYDVARGSWSSRPSLTTSRRRLAAATLDGVLYAVGGMNSGGAVLSSVEAFDPREGVWRSISSMRTERAGLGVAALDGRLYAVGGENYMIGFLNTVERYDPWSARWETVDSMSKRRADAAVCVVDDVLYAAGGQNWPTIYRSVERYRAGSGWEPAPSMITARCRAAVAAHNGRLYVAGGVDDHYVDLSSAAVFSPSSAAWSKLPADMPAGRTDASAVVVHCQPHDTKNEQKSGRSVDSKLASSRSSGLRAADVSSYERPSGSSQAAAGSVPAGRVRAAVAMLDDRTFKGPDTKNEQKSGRSVDSKLASSCFRSEPHAAVSTPHIPPAVGDCNKNAEVIPVVSSYERPSGSSQSAAGSVPAGRVRAAAVVLDDRSFKGPGTKNEQKSGRSVDSERQQQLFEPLLPPGELTQRVRADPLASAEQRELRQLVEALASHLTVFEGHKLTSGRERRTQLPLATDFGPHALLVVGGYTPDVLSLELSSGRWQSAAALPATRSYAGVAVLDGRVYVVGGHDGSRTVNTVFVYDVARGSWSSGPSLTTSRNELAAAALDGVLYAVGGQESRSGPVLSSAEAFDPREGVWRSIASMSTIRAGLGVAVLDRRLYAVGGENKNGSLNTVERYDPSSARWQTVDSMSERRSGAAVCVVDDVLYAAGGRNGSTAHRSVERYRAGSGWQPAPSMITARYDAAVATHDGRMYVAGGVDDRYNYLSSVEVFSPSSAAWSELPADMPAGRWAAAAVVVHWPQPAP